MTESYFNVKYTSSFTSSTCFSCCSPIASTCGSRAGLLPVKKSDELLPPWGIPSVCHMIVLIKLSLLHLHESDVVHYSAAQTALCHSSSDEEHEIDVKEVRRSCVTSSVTPPNPLLLLHTDRQAYTHFLNLNVLILAYHHLIYRIVTSGSSWRQPWTWLSNSLQCSYFCSGTLI